MTSPPTGPQAADCAPAERSSPAVYALVTSWCCPARTTARMAGVSLPAAFAVHFCALLLGLLATFIIINWEAFREHQPPATFVADAVTAWRQFDRELPSDAATRWAIVGGVALCFEVIVLAVALAVAPWGARDERLRDSIRHALHRTWLHTPHAVVALLLAGILTDELEIGRKRWIVESEARFLRNHPPPKLPSDSDDQAAMARYNSAQRAWRSHLNQEVYRQSRPWYRAYAYKLASIVNVAVIVWFVWALIRGVSAPRRVAPRTHAPLCRHCGYDLTGSPVDGRCPKCGAPDRDSGRGNGLGGIPWEHRARIGGWRAYARTFVASIRQPEKLARGVAIATSRAHALRFMAVNVVLASLVYSVICVASRYLQAWRNVGNISKTAEYWLSATLLFTLSAMLGVILLGTATAALVAAFILRAHDRRNLLGWIGQSAAYSSSYVALGFIVVQIFGDEVASTWSYWMRLRGHSFSAIQMLSHALGFVPTIIVALGYVAHLRRAVQGVRYAYR